MPYTEDERAVYGPYWNGEKEVFADPLAVYRGLISATEGDPNYWIGKARSGTLAEQAAAWDKLVPAARSALGLVAFDADTGKGATEAEVRKALSDFLVYCKKKGPSGLTPRTSSPPTTPPPYWVTGDWRLPTPDSASGSTSLESAASKPGR